MTHEQQKAAEQALSSVVASAQDPALPNLISALHRDFTRTVEGELDIFADDQIKGLILKAVADATDPKLLSDLSYHQQPWIRAGVARNPNTPPDVLLRLLTDPDPAVQWAASERK